MRARRLQLVLPGLAMLALVSCASSPAASVVPSRSTPHTRSHPSAVSSAAAPPTTTTTANTVPPGTGTLAPVSTAGSMQAGAPIALPISAGVVTATESPDGAVFAAPEDPTNQAQTMVWVVDGDSPAAVAEKMPGGVASLAADATNLYVAGYSSVTAFDRASGNQSAQWALPPVPGAASEDDLVALHAAGGVLFVSITDGATVNVYQITPTSSAPPSLVASGLSAAVGPDGSIYFEQADHQLALRRPNGAIIEGPLLPPARHALGGVAPYVEAVAGGAVWVSEPTGEGLTTAVRTYDANSLAALSSYAGVAAATVAGTAAGALVLQAVPGGSAACPLAAPPAPSSCVSRVDAHGVLSDPVGVGAAVALLGPAPAVVASDLSSDQFDVIRISSTPTTTTTTPTPAPSPTQ